jgi:hypothetical protein
MRAIICLLLLTTVAAPYTTQAQDKYYKPNELGLVGEGSLNGGPSTTAGIKYNRWNKKNIGFHIIAAYSNYNQLDYTSTRSYTADTAITSQKYRNIDMAVLGFGIDAQRQFFHRIYLYASLEVRAGYGSGSIDSSVSKYYNFTQPGYDLTITSTTGAGSTPAKMFYIGFSPAIGAKVVFNKITVGTEINDFATYTNLQVNNVHTSSTDINLSAINQRIFVQYRF